jgi:hypothetical protein
MHIFTLPFHGQELEVKISTSLSQQKMVATEIAADELLNSLSLLLGNDSLRSPIAHLNDSDINFPVELTDDVQHYLEINLEIAQQSQGKINPFTLEGNPVDVEDVSSYYKFNNGEKTVTRTHPIKFNPLILSASYILSQLEALLNNLGAISFLISYHNMQIARGAERWEISLLQPDTEENLEMMIQNEAVYMHLMPAIQSSEAIHNPFEAGVTAPNHTAIIIESVNLIQARLIAAFAAELHYDYEFTALTGKLNCGLTLLTDTGEVKQFST